MAGALKRDANVDIVEVTMFSRVRVAATALLVLLASLISPPVRSHIKGLWVVMEVLPSPIKPLSFFTPEPNKETVRLSSTEADVYRPRGLSEPPVLVVIHGANPEGKDDERVRRLARSLAAVGRLIVVPQLGLRHERIDERDPERIRDAISFASERGEVGLLAFSYGAGLALVALSVAPELRRKVMFVATVGTYFDLVHLLQGVTTETVPYGGENVPWRTIPQARELILQQMALFIGGEQGDELRNAWETKDPAGLDSEMQAVYRLLTNQDPVAFENLFDRLPRRLIDLMESLSPSDHVDDLDFPIYALHSTTDPAAPLSESRLLVDATREHGSRLFVVSLLQHVDPLQSPLGNLRDAMTFTRFSGLILQKQEGWPRI